MASRREFRGRIGRDGKSFVLLMRKQKQKEHGEALK